MDDVLLLRKLSLFSKMHFFFCNSLPKLKIKSGDISENQENIKVLFNNKEILTISVFCFFQLLHLHGLIQPLRLNLIACHLGSTLNFLQ